MDEARRKLIDFLATELARAVPAPVLELAELARSRHGQSVVGVLFYGSCLRQAEEAIGEGLLDFYLLVDEYRAAYGGRGLAAMANALLPPNVFYLEMPSPQGALRCKYAIMSRAAFATACRADAWNVSIWARFSQPAKLIWAKGERERATIAAACAEAVLTMIANAPVPVAGNGDLSEVWVRALEQTYAAELRSEGKARAPAIVAADRSHYQRLTPLAMAALAEQGRRAGEGAGALAWVGRRLLGKSLNALRLAKAAFTFEGGLDYILWKVKRHSGVEISVNDWQRRHPLMAAPSIAWRLYRRGAFR